MERLVAGDNPFLRVENINFPPLKIMYIPVTLPYEEMRDTKFLFMKLGIYAFTRRGKATGDVFIRYVGETQDTVDMEICFGVEAFLPETKEIKAKELEAVSGRYAVATYQGDRVYVPQVYMQMKEWFVGQGLQRSGGAMIEYLVNDPRKTPKQELLTDLYWPIIEEE